MKLRTVFLLIAFASSTAISQEPDSSPIPLRAEVRIPEIVELRKPKFLNYNGVRYYNPKPSILNDEYEEVAAYGVAAVEPLSKYLFSTSGGEQRTALRLLWWVREDAAIELQIRYSTEARSPFTRMYALSGLSGIRCLKVFEFIEQASTNDGDAKVREHAKQMLTNMGPIEMERGCFKR